MTNALKIPTYKTLATRISTNTSANSLLIQATNIRSSVKKHNAPSVYLILAEKAERKAKHLMPLELTRHYSPAPINSSSRECIAYDKYVFATSAMKNIGRYSIFRKQIGRLGYAAMLAKQVTKQVASPVYHALKDLGSVKMSAEYFIYKHGIQLVSADVYMQVVNLFEPKHISLKQLPKQLAIAA